MVFADNAIGCRPQDVSSRGDKCCNSKGFREVIPKEVGSKAGKWLWGAAQPCRGRTEAMREAISAFLCIVHCYPQHGQDRQCLPPNPCHCISTIKAEASNQRTKGLIHGGESGIRYQQLCWMWNLSNFVSSNQGTSGKRRKKDELGREGDRSITRVISSSNFFSYKFPSFPSNHQLFDLMDSFPLLPRYLVRNNHCRSELVTQW